MALNTYIYLYNFKLIRHIFTMAEMTYRYKSVQINFSHIAVMQPKKLRI